MLQLVLDTIPVRVFWKDRDSVFLGCNRLFALDAGLSSPDEIVGKTDYDMPWKPEADAYTADDREVMESGVPKLDYEEPQTTPDGRRIWLSTGKIPLTDEEGRTIGVMGVYEDITQRKQTEIALRKSEEKYRELVQSANSMILRWGRDGKIHFLNEFAQSFFGYTEQEVLGRSIIGTIVPERESCGRDLREMMGNIQTHPERYVTNVNENMRKSGDKVWIAWTNKLVADEYGNMTEILSVGLDVTARKHAEEALQESEARYRSIFNSNVGAFLLFETDGRVVDANDRAADLYGYQRSELIGLNSRDIVDPRFYHVFVDFVSTRLGEWFERESCDVRKDGTTFDVEIHGTKLRYSGKERLLAIVFDVTERNRARESMRLFTDVVHNMQVGLYIYRLEDPNDDHSLKLMAANPASTIELGLDPSATVGKYIDEIFPNLRQRGMPAKFAEVARTGVPFDMMDFEYSDPRLPHKHYSFRAFGLHGDQVCVLFEDITDLVRAEEDKRRFYRRTIEAATEGKLVVCDRGEIEAMAGPPIVSRGFVHGEDLGPVRHLVAGIAESRGMPESKVFDLTTCVGEAITNAVKHANGGVVSVHDADDALLVVVKDHGPGIQEINLPELALKRGYTTAISLGMGYKAMISMADRVYLATGAEGTIVGIEMKMHPAPAPIAGIALPDTW